MIPDDRRGRCYELAFQGIFHEDPPFPEGAVLVHGYPRLQGGEREGEKYGHAWIEWYEEIPFPNSDLTVKSLTVWDAVSQSTLPGVLYYKVGQIEDEECVRYTRLDAVEMAAVHETYGPWEKVPDDAIFGDD